MDLRSRIAKSSGKTYNILHAGSRHGGCKIFSSKSKSEGYHDGIGHKYFEDWFQKLLNDLDKSSLISLDNEPYHSRIKNKQPTSTWKNKDITEWLVKNIYFEPGSLKQELLHLARANKQDNQYVIDELAEQAGHKVLCLPPYHCQFNPIELIWSQTKNYYDKHIGKSGYREEAVLNMWEEYLRQVTPKNWSNCFSYLEKLLQQWWRGEYLLEEIEPIITTSSGDSYIRF
ncbi:DDE 3 domain containing protein [Asbolus verrucosus]|uniref:DDE 3 domain containing protein n=1 Tax=Asbolus verrucosus TaxID=1661398 RepID=A0A482VXE3_ASBVE|nr:DDE 3 domain containing protein [Asbolus verrucosus]